MSQMMFITAGLTNTLMFTMMKHPMSMGMVLLSQTLLVCMITSSMSQTPWFSYILFLVFLGGMLVLFIYMTSVASNDLFQKSTYKAHMWIMMAIMMILINTIIIDPSLLFNNTSEMMTNMNYKNITTAINLFNYPVNVMTTYTVLYLFLTLIVVVSITKSHQGPLRKKN